MPRVCQVTGKKTEVGMNVSHSHRRTKRTFKPNVQTMKFKSEILGREFSLKLTTSGLRTLVKHGGLDQYVMAKPASRLTEDMAKIKKAIVAKIGKPVAPEKKPVKRGVPARVAKKNGTVTKKAAADKRPMKTAGAREAKLAAKKAKKNRA